MIYHFSSCSERGLIEILKMIHAISLYNEAALEIVIDCGDYSLKNSLTPSFVSSLYESMRPDTWIKVAGRLGGMLKIEQRGRQLIISSTAEVSKNELEQLALLETGLWHDEFERELRKLPPSFRSVAEILAEAYPGVRVPIAPWDFDYIITAVLLSKRANYTMVRRWCRRLWEIFGDNLHNFPSAKSSTLRKITRSYQLKNATRSLKDLIRVVEEPERVNPEIIKRFGIPWKPISEYILNLPPEIARLILLSAWGIGPKVADSTILSTFRAPHFIPCDIHLRIFVERLSLVEDLRMPEKAYCRKFLCGNESAWGLSPCSSDKCLRAILRSLGECGGWIQTLIYLHGKEYCRSMKPRCSECPLKKSCPSSGKIERVRV